MVLTVSEQLLLTTSRKMKNRKKNNAINKDDDDVVVIREGLLTKKILRKGTGTEKPKSGQLVYVHYVGKLTDGTQFDSSRSRNRPFSFLLQKGQVIMAWDMGIATMTKGEKAILTAAPEYAYGKNGYPPVIPKNATLIFEVELLEFKDDDRKPISWIVTLIICAIPIIMVLYRFGLISF